MQEREISLVDLIVEVLLRWRMFIVWMLCGAVLFGGLSYVRTWRSANAQAAQVEEAKRQLEAEDQESTQGESLSADPKLLQQVTEHLTDTQKLNVDLVLKYEKWLVEKENSALLLIDANNVPRAKLTFYISAESKERSYSIESVYEDMIANGALAQYIAEQLDIPSNVTELLGLQSLRASRLQGVDSFSAWVIHYDEQVCRDMSQAVIDFIQSKHDELVDSLGEHEIMVVNSDFAVIHDSGIASTQQDLLSSMINIQNKVLDLKTNFSDQEWQYYDVMINGEITGLDSVETVSQDLLDIIERGVTVTPGISKKYVLLGMVMAAFVYAFCLFMIYVLNTKIRATDNLQQIYAIPQLGLIPAQTGRKRAFGFVDKWIEALRDRNRRRFTSSEALGLAAVAVKMAVERKELKSVHLLGCDLKEQSLAVCEQIKESLSKDNIQAIILNNVLYDAAALNSLDNAEGVVLVEKAGSTLYTEIEQELELLKREEICLLGGIVVE